MKRQKSHISVVLLGAGVSLFLLSLYPNFVTGNHVAGDFLELAGTALAVVGGGIVVFAVSNRRLARWSYLAGAALLVVARIADWTEELAVFDPVPLFGAEGWGGGAFPHAATALGYIFVFLTLLAVTAELYHSKQDAQHGRNRYKRLHEAALHLSKVADMAAQPVIGVDWNGAIRSWNRAARALFGYSPGEAYKLHIDDLLTPAGNGASFSQFIRQGALGGGPLEAKGKARSGKEFEAEAAVSTVPGENGQSVGLSIIVRDMDRRKAEERAFLESHNLLSRALQQAEVGMFILDRDGRIVEFNRQMETLTGLSRGEIPPLEVCGRELVDPKLNLARRVRYEVLGEGRAIKLNNVTLFQPQGGTRICNLAIAPVFGLEGQIIGAGAIAVDMTEREFLQRNLYEAQRIEGIGRLAGGIAHDFNNILASILGYASLLRQRAGGEGQAAHYAGSIEDAARQGSKLTQQLLAFAKRGAFDFAEVNLNEIVEETIRLVSRGLPAKVRIGLTAAGGIPAIKADASQMQQLIMNLILNARDAVGEQGGIHVATHALDAGREERERLELPAEGLYVHLRVADDGAGISAETLGHIFEPFFSTKGNDESYGLGLAVVHSIVNAHHGVIRVASEPGKGAAFDVYLPALPHLAPESEPPGVFETPPAEGAETVLIVDDETIIRSVLRDILEAHGYEVLEAESGEKAVSIFKRKGAHIAVAVLDLNLQGIGGEETLTALRERDPDLRCIVTSGHSLDEIRARLTGDENTRIIAKPFNAPELVTAIRELIDQTLA